MKGKPPLTPLFWVALSLITLFNMTHSRAANAPITDDDLGGSERYLAYASTDKPIYRAGDNVYLRAIVLNALDNTPHKPGHHSYKVVINGPKGDIVHEGFTREDASAVGYRWTVPNDMTGGLYTAKISSPTIGLPATERRFEIRAFRTPRVKTQIQFMRDGYGAGDTVRASVLIERAEGGVPKGARISAIARVDGIEVYRGPTQTMTDSGQIDTEFNLPDQMESGIGSLSFVIEDGGVVETASKSLPIVLQRLDIAFYPEGGELIAGLPGRVYFQALLPNGKPADVAGSIVEIDGTEAGRQSITTFSSQHEGRGWFQFTPESGKRYAAVFSEPTGVTQPASLPGVSNSGAVIQSAQHAYAYDDSIDLTVQSTADRKIARVTLYKRNTELDSQPVTSGQVQLDAGDAEGVLIATLWDEQNQPLAERLIYRKPRFALNVSLELSDGPYTPGGDVSLDVLTTDESGNPVEAVVGITVTDDTVLELIEKRQQSPSLPVMVYLENEVRDLADAHVYLDDNNPIADTAIDLLLATQGWRRFVLSSYEEIKQQFPEHAARIMAQASRPAPVLRMQRLERAMVRGMAFDAEIADDALLDAAPQNNAAPPAQPARVEQEEAPAPVAAVAQKEIDADVPQADIANADLLGAQPAMKIAAEMVIMPRPGGMGYIREFAFATRPDRQPADRIDFTETLYWNSGVKTGARNGRATVKFSLSDSVTTFRVSADAFASNGALGAGTTVFASVEPFYITTKPPLHAIVGDVIELPVNLVNTTDQPLNNASLEITGEGIGAYSSTPVTLAVGQRLRTVIPVKTTLPGTFEITVAAKAGPFTDRMTRKITISPAGFPIALNHGGLLSASTPFTRTVTIPGNVVAGSMNVTAKVYPSPLASMEEALNALLREPHGCFEQTSSTNYPLVMAQQYFDSHTGVNPATIARSRDLLKTGYDKLIGFESADHGYEWFGENPAHEALTAYGLMEFTDMARVMSVDSSMIDRTRQWLLDRRDGKGGFKRNERALDSFGRAPAPTTNAYIVWALLESGQSPQSLIAEIDHIKKQAFEKNDSYIDALAANILYLADDRDSAELLLRKLSQSTNKEGAVAGASTSITGSGGDALMIETTSLALLAWLRNDAQWAAQVETSIKWLFERSKSGRFGSTQSTVLALKAINAYDAVRAAPKQSGAVQLWVDGQAIGEAIEFTPQSKGAISLPDFASVLTAGQHQLELRMSDGSKMPFALDITFNTPVPHSAETTPVTLATTLSHNSITESEPMEMLATITVGNDIVPTPIAIIGIPAGLELRHEQLKELIGQGSISAYEVRGSELILYWRALKADEVRTIPIGLTAAVPGTYTAPASRVYPYYTDEQKHWLAGHFVEVVAR